MILEHYSLRGVTRVRSAPQTTPTDKPAGFWVSVVGPADWPRFCISEDFSVDGMKVVQQVTLSDDANICMISSAEELRAFGDKYVVPSPIESLRDIKSDFWLDWAAVADEYDGIIISPYQWSCRLKVRWYYTWDCASGCIWNASAIRELSPPKRVDLNALRERCNNYLR